MNDEAYKFNVEQTRAALRRQAAGFPMQDGYAYTSAADFLVQHGVDYPPGQAWKHYPRGAEKECFGNAIGLAASRRIPYVEGVAMSPKGEVFPHAWNLNPPSDGQRGEATHSLDSPEELAAHIQTHMPLENSQEEMDTLAGDK